MEIKPAVLTANNSQTQLKYCWRLGRMEQVRIALAWIAKYHFWLLSVMAILISTAVWYLAAGDLDERKKTNLRRSQQPSRARTTQLSPVSRQRTGERRSNKAKS